MGGRRLFKCELSRGDAGVIAEVVIVHERGAEGCVVSAMGWLVAWMISSEMVVGALAFAIGDDVVFECWKKRVSGCVGEEELRRKRRDTFFDKSFCFGLGIGGQRLNAFEFLDLGLHLLLGQWMNEIGRAHV